MSSELNEFSSVLLLPVFAVSSKLNDFSSVLLLPLFAVSSELMTFHQYNCYLCLQ